MTDFYIFPDELDFYGLTVDDLLNAGFEWDDSMQAYKFSGTDTDNNGIPDAIEALLGIGVIQNPSQGNIGG